MRGRAYRCSNWLHCWWKSLEQAAVLRSKHSCGAPQWGFAGVVEITPSALASPKPRRELEHRQHGILTDRTDIRNRSVTSSLRNMVLGRSKGSSGLAPRTLCALAQTDRGGGDGRVHRRPTHRRRRTTRRGVHGGSLSRARPHRRRDKEAPTTPTADHGGPSGPKRGPVLAVIRRFSPRGQGC